jgi:regulator of replication initiation timing
MDRYDALTDALTDAEAAAAEVGRQHDELLARAASALDELTDLRLEIDGLKKAIARHERQRTHARKVVDHAAGAEPRPPITAEQYTPTTPPTSETVAPSEGQQPLATNGQAGGDWQSLARTEAVEKMLAEVGEPISPMNLSRKLQEVGRSDDSLAVGKALNHLYRKKRATTVGRAKWVLTHEIFDRQGLPPTSGGTQAEELEKEVSGDQEVNGAAPTLTGGERWS